MQDFNLFLQQLATDPALQQAYAANPQQVLQQAGLSAEAQAAVLNGDKAQLALLMNQQSAKTAFFFFDTKLAA